MRSLLWPSLFCTWVSWMLIIVNAVLWVSWPLTRYCCFLHLIILWLQCNNLNPTYNFTPVTPRWQQSRLHFTDYFLVSRNGFSGKPYSLCWFSLVYRWILLKGRAGPILSWVCINNINCRCNWELLFIRSKVSIASWTHCSDQRLSMNSGPNSKHVWW